MLCFNQDVNVVDQEKIDKLMLDMDGTENKCKVTFGFNVLTLVAASMWFSA